MTKKLFTNGRSLLCSLLLLTAFIIPNGLMAEITCSFSGNTLRISGDDNSTTLNNDEIFNRLTSEQRGDMEIVYVSGFKCIEHHTFSNFMNVKKIVVSGGNTPVSVGCGAFGRYVEELELNCDFVFPVTKEYNDVYNIFTAVNYTAAAVQKVKWTGHAPAGAFRGCENLISIPTITASNYPADPSTFTNCISLKNIDVDIDLTCSYKNYTEDTSIGRLFPTVERVRVLGSAISGSNSITNYAFANMNNLKEVYLPSQSHIVATNAFYGCENQVKVYYEAELSILQTYDVWWNLVKDKARTMKTVFVPSDDVASHNIAELFPNMKKLIISPFVKELGARFCYGSQTLQDVIIPKSVQTIGSSAFVGCNNARVTFEASAALSKTYTMSSNLASAFADVKDITIAKDATVGEYAFYGLSSLQRLSLGENATINNCSFYNTNVAEFNLPKEVTINGNPFNTVNFLAFNSNQLLGDAEYDLTQKFGDIKSLYFDYGVTAIGANRFTRVPSLEKVVISGSVTSVGERAFEGRENLKEVVIGSNVCSIGERAFQNCNNLNVTELPSGLATIGNYAFDGCANITSLTFKNNNFLSTSNFTNEDNVTTRFPYLENVIFLSPDRIAEYAFVNSVNLKSVTFNGVSVPTIGNNSFEGCSNITEVKYPFAESSIALDKWKMLNNCFPSASAQKLYVPNNYISNSSELTKVENNLAVLYPDVKEITFGPYVNTIGSYLMSSAKNLEVANIGSKVSSINYMSFAHCSNLTTVNYQGDESKITIDDEAFIGCPLIGQVSYHNWIASFSNPENVKELTITNDNIADYEWDGLYNIATLFPNVEKVVFGPEVTRIHDNCLKGARNLKEVEFNEGLKYIGLNIIDDSRLLTSITIPSTVEEMKDYAIVLEGQDVDVTFKTLAFLNAKATNNNEFVKIYPATYSDGNGESVPSHVSFNFEGIVTIPVYAFQNLEALTNVNLGTTARIGTCAFKGCTNLESIEISENVTYLDKDAFTGMNGKVTLLGANYRGGSFTDCFGNDVTEVVYGDNITSISFPANYPSLQKLTIGANVEKVIGFSQCANLKSVTINSNSFAANANGEGWTKTSNLSAYFPFIKEVSFGDCVQELGANILYGNNTVESVTFSGYNVSVGASAFESCEQLKAVNGNSIGAIGANAFRGCSKLAKCEGTSYTGSLGVNAFQGCASLEAYNMHIGCKINTEDGLSNAFDGCVKLKTFTVTGSQKEAEGTPAIEGLNFFGGVNLANATLVVDNDFYNAFQNAPVWKDFGNMGTTWYEVFADAIPYNSEYPNYSSEITYSRNFKNTEWQALYIPFSLAYEDWKDEFDIAYVNDVHQLDTDDDGEIDMTVLETIKLKSGVTKPSEPYIIRAHSTGKKTIHADAQYILPSEVTTFDVSSRNTIFNFTGTYSGVSGAEMLEKGYYAFGGGSLIQADSADADLLPCRWYMEVVDRNNNPQPSLGKVRVVVRGEDDTTDIKTLVMGNSDEASDDAIFDLSGRKVSNAQKGIYIKNGKKIVVR